MIKKSFAFTPGGGGGIDLENAAFLFRSAPNLQDIKKMKATWASDLEMDPSVAPPTVVQPAGAGAAEPAGFWGGWWGGNGRTRVGFLQHD